MKGKYQLLLTFYGDDFTGSTDALEQLTLAGIRSALFIKPPTPRQLARFKGLQALGVAGLTRSMSPNEMAHELKPALKKLKALGAPHVHYKVCSTFDSSPRIGSIGRVIDVATEIFRESFVPVLAAAPSLGRYTVFGNHFARYGIGSAGAIHRLDRHPSISKHPVTPMTEADLCVHLGKQTKKRIALFDILKVSLPKKEAHLALKRILSDKPDIVLFDALHSEHLAVIGELMNAHANTKRPLFSVGSSGVETALAAHAIKAECRKRKIECSQSLLTSAPTRQVLVGSGSCSPVTTGQIAWALQHGFAGVALEPLKLTSGKTADIEIRRVADSAAGYLQTGHSVIIHTTSKGPEREVASRLKNRTARLLGMAVGKSLRLAAEQSNVRRICVAGGDTSSFAARAMGIEAVEMIAPLTPGAPLCRAYARGSPLDGREVLFKGGQVGGENYFEIVRKGNR